MTERIAEASPRSRARITGVVYLLFFVTAVLGEFFTRQAGISGIQLGISGDAAATANTILVHELLYRLGFALGLISTACYVAVTALFYQLFRSVNRSLSFFLSVGALDHDLAFTLDPTGAHGRLNHIAFAVDTREDLMRAADILRDYGQESLEFGPGRHGVAGAFSLYAREPGGNRIEVYTPEALILAPDWKPVRWLASQNPLMYWGGEVPFSVIGDATPPIERP